MLAQLTIDRVNHLQNVKCNAGIVSDMIWYDMIRSVNQNLQVFTSFAVSFTPHVGKSWPAEMKGTWMCFSEWYSLLRLFWQLTVSQWPCLGVCSTYIAAVSVTFSLAALMKVTVAVCLWHFLMKDKSPSSWKPRAVCSPELSRRSRRNCLDWIYIGKDDNNIDKQRPTWSKCFVILNHLNAPKADWKEVHLPDLFSRICDTILMASMSAKNIFEGQITSIRLFVFKSG